MKPQKLVHGMGLNDSDYAVTKYETIGYGDGKQKRKQVWTCPYYQTWKSMLERCFSTKFQERNPTYKDCSVSTEWLTFNNFRSWMATQDWEGKQLDKDLLFKGNKVYRAETCMFVTPLVNTFTNDCGATRGEWLTGASWHKASEKFISHCRNPFTKKYEYLGCFTSEQQAHQAWLKRKIELAHLLAAEQTDERVAKALILKYTNYKASMDE